MPGTPESSVDHPMRVPLLLPRVDTPGSLRGFHVDDGGSRGGGGVRTHSPLGTSTKFQF